MGTIAAHGSAVVVDSVDGLVVDSVGAHVGMVTTGAWPMLKSRSHGDIVVAASGCGGCGVAAGAVTVICTSFS